MMLVSAAVMALTGRARTYDEELLEG